MEIIAKTAHNISMHILLQDMRNLAMNRAVTLQLSDLQLPCAKVFDCILYVV
jgi:hypothetical protein